MPNERPGPLRLSVHHRDSRRSTYFEAVAVYERALDAIQRRDFRVAVELLESILRFSPRRRSCTNGYAST